MGKYVSILSTKSDQKLDGVIFTSYKNRDGNITILVVNNTKESVILDIAVENANKKQTFYLYQVTENILKTVDFKLNPVTKYKKSNIFNSVEILPESITVLTTNGLRHAMSPTPSRTQPRQSCQNISRHALRILSSSLHSNHICCSIHPNAVPDNIRSRIHD